MAKRLSAQGVGCFFDKWHLVPGEPWQERLKDALAANSTYAVFLGLTGISPWQNKEMRVALAEPSARVIPVLLPGSSQPGEEELPSFLRLLTWVDARAGVDDDEALRRLIAGIRGVTPEQIERRAPSKRWNVPYPRAQYFTGRDDVIEQLHKALNAEGSAALGQAIHGLGGIGKTQTAVEYCDRYREEYQAVLWTRQ